ncbi:MAG: SIMPL domain-containing protein [Comamonadaceae bacterium]|jgi:predicted secreted protein
MNRLIRIGAACAILAASAGGMAQHAQQSMAQNVVQLSATGVVEVQQDLLSIFLSTARDGNDAAAVQSQLKMALDTALTEARKSVQAGQFDLRTGNFSVTPRYGRDGKATGWQGSAELILEGRDFARLGAAAGRIQTLSVSGMSVGLSRERRVSVEGEAQSMAIERFKARAMDISRSFGFTGFTLLEVNVNSNDQTISPRPRMLAMEARPMAADVPVPVEAGKTSVLVTVSGSVQLK